MFERVWGDSEVDWINLRRIFNKTEMKAFSLSYPFLGQYIVASDNYFFSEPRVETYALYFGLLLISILGIIFSVSCPFFFKENDTPVLFVKSFPKTQENRARLRRALRLEEIDDGVEWSTYLTNVWEEHIDISLRLRTIMKISLVVAFFCIFFCSVVSVGRVLFTLIG